MKKKFSLFFLSLSCIVVCVNAQPGTTTARELVKNTSAFKNARDAADQKIDFKSKVTDQITRYYQALIKSGVVNQKDGEIKVKSTLYGIIRIFDSTRREEQYFKTLRWARNTQLGAGVVLNNDNQITTGDFSLSVALVNNREYKGDMFSENGITDNTLTEATQVLAILQHKIDSIIVEPSLTETQLDSVGKKYEGAFEEFNKTTDFSIFKDLLTPSEMEDIKSKWGRLIKIYTDIRKKLSGGALLTLGSSGKYSDNSWTYNKSQLEFLVGLGHKSDSVRKYDFYAGAFYESMKDTVRKTSSLNRRLFTSKLGINTVLFKDKVDGSSLVEAFGGAEYTYTNKEALYAGEKTSALKLDVTVSFRLAKNFYLPFEVKYNATTGRFEGFVDLKFDVVNIFK